MILIPHQLKEQVKAQNELNTLTNQVQQELYNLALPFVGKKVIKTTPYRSLTKQFKQALGDLPYNSQQKVLVEPTTYSISVTVQIYHIITEDKGFYRDNGFTLGKLDDGYILNDVMEPTVRDTNIVYEEVLERYKKLQELDEQMDTIRRSISKFIQSIKTLRIYKALEYSSGLYSVLRSNYEVE